MALAAQELSRLRWRCRRGMLENDLILTRFLDAEAGSLDEADLAALEKLLDLSDNQLWDIFSGRAPAPDPTTIALVKRLQAA
jgi:antitoxin CptB